jgi:hypothetical protein
MNTYTIHDDVNRTSGQMFLADTAAHAARIAKAMVREGHTGRASIYGRHIDDSGPLAHVERSGGSVVLSATSKAPKSLR